MTKNQKTACYRFVAKKTSRPELCRPAYSTEKHGYYFTDGYRYLFVSKRLYGEIDKEQLASRCINFDYYWNVNFDRWKQAKSFTLDEVKEVYKQDKQALFEVLPNCYFRAKYIIDAFEACGKIHSVDVAFNRNGECRGLLVSGWDEIYAIILPCRPSKVV